MNKELFESCIDKSDDKSLDKVDPAIVILKELWKRLQDTHRSRVVKLHLRVEFLIAIMYQKRNPGFNKGKKIWNLYPFLN